MKLSSACFILSLACFAAATEASNMEEVEREFLNNSQHWSLKEAEALRGQVFLNGECYDMFNPHSATRSAVAFFGDDHATSAHFVVKTERETSESVMAIAKEYHENSRASDLQQSLLGNLFITVPNENGVWTLTFKLIKASQLLIVRSTFSAGGYFCPDGSFSCSRREAVYLEAGETGLICIARLSQDRPLRE